MRPLRDLRAFAVPSPTTIYAKAADLIRHCCNNEKVVQTIYWRSDRQPEHAMVFFLEDGGLILGVSTPAADNQRVDWIAADLGCFVHTDNVVVTYEDLPPESTQGFLSFLQSLPSNPDETVRRSRAHRPIKGEQSTSNGG